MTNDRYPQDFLELAKKTGEIELSIQKEIIFHSIKQKVEGDGDVETHWVIFLSYKRSLKGGSPGLSKGPIRGPISTSLSNIWHWHLP